MYRITIILIIILIVFAGSAFLLFLQDNSTTVKATISVAEAMVSQDTEGFVRAVAPGEFKFPEDHGPHNEFKTEWWYYTGNLKTNKGKHFGFQFTIFRNSLSPDSVKRISTWSTNQVYMAHFTVTDVEQNEFHSFERFSRAAAGLAGANIKPFRIWLEDWSIESSDMESNPHKPTMVIHAQQDDIAIHLELQSTKPIVLNGEQGLSQKGAEPGNASYYYSMTRLNAQGHIQIRGNTYEVKGLAWLDREWSTSALGEDQIGWDWFSLQLDDDREIMYYQIRNRDGSASQFSQGTLVDVDGTHRTISAEDVQLRVLDYWTSPGGVRYPSHWQLTIPNEKTELEIKPYVSNQELDASIRYWEGAVEIRGTSRGKSTSGNGYVELTGYGDKTK